ncbi:MAG: hypothetical protein IKL62_02530 [Clostridia bacterium]|nr:hypothetical protein [Clostridia bacterium]
MKISKGQGVSLFTSIIIFTIFNIVVFLAPLAHTVVFWLGYFFALYALITFALTLTLYFGKPVKEDKFLSLPAVKIAWVYFIIQTALSLFEMIACPLPYLTVLIINLVLGAVFAFIILALYSASARIDKTEQYTAEKVLFIKQLKLQLDSAQTDDEELTKAIKKLSEDVRYSDPMSHSKLAAIENSIFEAVDELVYCLNDKEKALNVCGQISKMLKTRNEQCKMYKGVKDVSAAAAQKSGSGKGIAFGGVCAALALLLITVSVCFYIVPQNKYDAAMALLNEGKYAEAIVVFEELGDYRDSEAKIKEINEIVLKAQYEQAEKFFEADQYTEALAIYTALNGYNDSTARIEEIHNRLSSGKVIYFGTYNGKPVAWQIVKKEDGKLLLLADKAVKNLPIHSELQDIEFKESDIRFWLNEEFLADFTDEQIDKIITTDDMKVFLLDEATVKQLKKDKVKLNSDFEWWIAEKSENGYKYVDKSGNVVKNGDLVIRDKGIRPAIWISID